MITKIRMLKFALFLILISIIIYCLNDKIENYDMRYYSGKDNGAFVRIYSITILSSLFYLIMSIKFRIIQLIKGFFIGFFSSIVSYILVGLFLHKIFSNFGLTFHVLGCLIFILIFFMIEKVKLREV